MTVLAEGFEFGERLNRAQGNFLKLDVEVGLTFAGIALQTQDPEKRERTRRVASKAYDTVLRLMNRVTFTKDGAQSLARNLLRLKYDLMMLGEVF
jgi:hypothetical protein